MKYKGTTIKETTGRNGIVKVGATFETENADLFRVFIERGIIIEQKEQKEKIKTKELKEDFETKNEG